MNEAEVLAHRAAIAALEGQRATLGDAATDIAVAPLRARLASLQQPAELKHRLVTVLFADVVGSTALASGLDAEDTLGLLSGVLQRMATIIEDHQGRVLRFTGDGLKAAFGMDETREDDAERAVRAGLAILQAGREQAEGAARQHGVTDCAVRVGVHSGDVALGAGVEHDNTAMGAAVNIAARMEQHAPPGGLRISHDTWGHVRGLFELETQPPLQVKGIAAPMQTYLVSTARDRVLAQVERGLQGLRTPMVGRGDELLRLQDLVERARQVRQLHAVTVVGDAGLGKSRLLRALVAALQDCRVLALRSQPDGQLRPWGLLRSLLALQCGVADTDSAESAQRKVVEGLSPGFEERGERQAQLIGQLSGLDFGESPSIKGLDPRSLRDQALLALRAYLKGLAAQGQGLTVLVVEDLHWADDSSLDLLQHLQSHAAELPLVLVMTARPPLLTRRNDWSPPDGLLILSPLAPTQSTALVQALLHHLGEVPPRLNELIAGRAEGNPYYMEELVRRLIDDGVIDATGPQWRVQLDRLDTLRLPTTLVGLLQARLDALPAGVRQAARQASVIGHVFWDDALQSLDGQAPLALPALQRAAFVKARNTSDFEGTTERQFDHHLLHQVTYDTLLKAERKLGHGAAARWLQARTRGRGAEFLAMTGEHAECAGELTLAIDCFDQAAKEARQRFANAAAVAWLRRALALLGESDPARRFGLLERLLIIVDSAGDRSEQAALLDQMGALLQVHPHTGHQAKLRYFQALLAERCSDFAASEQFSLQAYELAVASEEAYTAACAQGNRAWLRLARQDHLGAVEPLQVGLQWACKIGDAHARAETEAKLLMLSGIISVVMSDFDQARQTLTELLARGQTLSSPRLQLGALDNLAMVASYLGHWPEAMALGERMIPLAHSTGAPPDLIGAQFRIAQAAASAGDHTQAIGLHQQNLEMLRITGNRRQEAASMRFLGVSHLALGQTQTALQWFLQAQSVFRTCDEPVEEAENAADMALCLARLGQLEEAALAVRGLMERLDSDLAPHAGQRTIEMRWACQQVLDEVGDGLARPMLEQLLADVQVRVAELTHAADRERLIQAIPHFRDIVAAHSRGTKPDALR